MGRVNIHVWTYGPPTDSIYIRLIKLQGSKHGNLLLWRIWYLLPGDEIPLDKHLRCPVQRPLPVPLHHGHMSPPDPFLLGKQIPHSNDFTILGLTTELSNRRILLSLQSDGPSIRNKENLIKPDD